MTPVHAHNIGNLVSQRDLTQQHVSATTGQALPALRLIIPIAGIPHGNEFNKFIERESRIVRNPKLGGDGLP